MLYRKINFSESKILSNLLFDIYDLSSKEGCTYSTAPNGILGISVVTKGDCLIRHNNNWKKSIGSAIYGLVDGPDLIKVSSNFREVAFGFKPYFFQLLTKEKMSSIVNEGNMDTSFVFNAQSVNELVDRIKNSESDQQIICAIETFVMSHYLETEFDSRVLRAMDMIYTNNIYSIDTICQHINLSSAGLRNLFQTKIGRSPKAVSNIIRINKTLHNFDPHSPLSLQSISFDNGYFDQSHFINDFKKTIGLTPKQYFSNKKLAFDFYNSGRWSGDIFAESI